MDKHSGLFWRSISDEKKVLQHCHFFEFKILKLESRKNYNPFIFEGAQTFKPMTFNLKALYRPNNMRGVA